MIDHFLFSLCNCSNYCIKVNYVTTCSSDIAFVITNVMIKGEQALRLQNITNLKLHRANVTVEFKSNVYHIFCVLTDLCGDISVAPDDNITVSASSNTATNKIADEVIIYILLVLILIVVIALLLIIIIIRKVLKSKKYFFQTAKNTSYPHVISTEVVFGESRNEIAGKMPDDTRAHEYEDPDHDITIKYFNPAYQRNTSAQITTANFSNAETLINDLQTSSVSNGNSSQYACLQVGHAEVQGSMDNDVNCKSEENDSTQVINNNSTTNYDDTVVSIYDDTVLQPNKTNNSSNYDKLQHTALETSKIPEDNEEIKWVTNPNYNSVNVPITPISTSTKKAKLSYEAIDKGYDDTIVEINCKNCNTATVMTTSPENNNISSTTWDKDRSSFVTGYSSRVILPQAKLSTSSTHREGNEVPINQLSSQMPVASICEWISSDV